MLGIEPDDAEDMLLRRVFHGVRIDGGWFVSREAVVERIEELAEAGVTIHHGEPGPVLSE